MIAHDIRINANNYSGVGRQALRSTANGLTMLSVAEKLGNQLTDDLARRLVSCAIVIGAGQGRNSAESIQALLPKLDDSARKKLGAYIPNEGAWIERHRAAQVDFLDFQGEKFTDSRGTAGKSTASQSPPIVRASFLARTTKPFVYGMRNPGSPSGIP